MKAAPDGYTLLFTAEPLWTMPYLQKVSFDPVKDFIPVALVGKAPTILVVHPSVPVNSVAELIALAKSKPGTLNYSAGASGAASHVAGELFKSMAGIEVVRVPYNGAGPALTSVVSGVTQFTFGTAASAAFVKSGRLRGLAVTSARPSAVFPSMPTLASSAARLRGDVNLRRTGAGEDPAGDRRKIQPRDQHRTGEPRCEGSFPRCRRGSGRRHAAGVRGRHASRDR